MTHVADIIQVRIAEIALIARDVFNERDADALGMRLARAYEQLEEQTQYLLLHEDPFHVAAEALERDESAPDYEKYVILTNRPEWLVSREDMRSTLFPKADEKSASNKKEPFYAEPIFAQQHTSANVANSHENNRILQNRIIDDAVDNIVNSSFDVMARHTYSDYYLHLIPTEKERDLVENYKEKVLFAGDKHVATTNIVIFSYDSGELKLLEPSMLNIHRMEPPEIIGYQSGFVKERENFQEYRKIYWELGKKLTDHGSLPQHGSWFWVGNYKKRHTRG